jgi:beta-N-acetylhexosaminidase
VNNCISRRRFLQGGGLGAVAALAVGCASNNSPLVAAGSAAPAVSLAFASPKRPPLEGPLRAHLPTPDVPLEVKIGQMIMLGFRGRSLTEQSAILRSVGDFHVGSVVLFRANVESPSQLAALTADLQAAAERPLLISIDHEGGLVNRFGSDFGFVSNLSAQELGVRNDLDATRAQAENAAQRLAAFGINLNLAPVVDLNVNPTSPAIGRVLRSYSADPAVVSEHARVVIESHHKHNVLCTLKHFPGHGSARTDSHVSFVDVSESWQESELLPYQSLIRAGLCDVVMTAHIFNANLDPTYPATLSQPIITGILRQRLGYDGVVMSDDLQMRAISRQYGFPTAVQLAVEAGVDILAIANSLAHSADAAERIVGIVHTLVEQGKLSAERIDASYRRIMRLKARLNLPARDRTVA